MYIFNYKKQISKKLVHMFYRTFQSFNHQLALSEINSSLLNNNAKFTK